MRRSALRLGITLIAALTIGAALLTFADDPAVRPPASAHLVRDFEVPAAQVYRKQHGLMINMVPLADRGILVFSVQPGSPTGAMVRADEPSIRGKLRPGDVITHVNGQPVRTLADYESALERSGGEVTLTVADKRRGHAAVWRSRTAETLVPIVPDPAVAPDLASGGRKVHALLIGLTDTPPGDNLGACVEVSLRYLRSVLKHEIAKEYLDLEVITGPDCEARTIIRKVRELGSRSKPGDAIFCYYAGHGAYDPQDAAGDPAGGHFLDLPGAGLRRKTLFDNLLAQPGRLKVLVTDCCNKATLRKSIPRYQLSMVELIGPTPVEKLLLYHRGYLDINAVSRDQWSWYQDGMGGFFSLTLVRLLPRYSEWQPFLDDLAVASNALYLEKRGEIIQGASAESPPAVLDMKSQTAMTPAVFQMALARDAQIAPGPRRLIAREYPMFMDVREPPPR